MSGTIARRTRPERVATPVLAAIAAGLVLARDLWRPRVRHDPDRRFYEHLVATDGYDAWLIGWSPGQAIAAHDHGRSAGALAVADGRLVERRWGADGATHTETLTPGNAPAVFAAEDVHAVANLDAGVATSIHVYSPPLASMRWFVDDGDDLRVRAEQDVTPSSSHPRSIDDALARARARLHRLQPEEARRATAVGAVLVDIRPEADRRAEGAIPGAVVIERNVLEWRLDPRSPACHPVVTDLETPVIVVCNEGYASTLAAAALQDLGLVNATDLAGGFRHWRRAGLPISPP